MALILSRNSGWICPSGCGPTLSRKLAPRLATSTKPRIKVRADLYSRSFLLYAQVSLLDRDGEKAAQTAAELGSDCIAVQADVGEVPAGGRNPLSSGALRQAGRSAQQCGHREPFQAAGPDHGAPMGRADAHQCEIGSLDNTLCPGCSGKGSILNTASMVGSIDWTGQSRRVCRLQVHPHRADKSDGLGLRSEGNSQECHLPCRRVDADARKVVFRATRARPQSVIPRRDSPLGACPHGDVIADRAVFLLSQRARPITGCILPVGGGAELGYRR